jgi:hypothetical protein
MNEKRFFLCCVVLFVLVLGSLLSAEESTINGNVFDESGKPVAGAQVYTEMSDVLSMDKICVTDNNGCFAIRLPSEKINPWRGLYAISSDKQQLGRATIQLNEGKSKIPDLSITLKPARMITGNVTDSNGKPIEDVWVAGVYQTVYPSVAKTDKNGNFRFAYPKDNLVPLQQIVAFLENVGMDYICTEELNESRRKIPPEKIKNDSFQLKLNRFESYKIRVVDENKTPLSGITVYPWLIKKENVNDSFNTVDFSLRPENLTNIDGFAVVQAIGKTTVFNAYCPDEGIVLSDGSRVFFAFASGEWDVLTSSESIPTLVLKRRGNVKGSVKLADGTPVVWSRITIKRHYTCGHGIRWTNQKGEFTLKYKANELFDVGVESELGAAPGAFGFDVGDGVTEKRLDFVLQKGIRLHGTVYKPDKTPAEQYQIFIHEKCPEDLSTTIKNAIGTNQDQATCPPGGCGAGIVIRQNSDYSQQNSGGKYEYLLPAVSRKYDIFVSLYSDPELQLTLENYEVQGNETEILLDLHLKPKEKK